MAAAQRKTPEKDPIAEAARQALKTANGDLKAAVGIFELAVRSNPTLRDALTEPLIANACYAAVAREIRAERQKVWQQPVERLVPRQGGVSGTARVVHLAAGTLLMFPLPGGKKLGEATREELSEAASFYEAQSADMAHKARWLRLVAQSVPGEQKVGDVLTDDRLRELQEATRDA